MNSIVSSLTLLPPETIRFHESHENKRLEKICSSMQQEGCLRNPPLVTPLRNGEYLLLDGAHRMMAMLALGCKRVVVQVVPPEQIELSSWGHILHVGDWWDALQHDPALAWSDEPVDGARLLARVLRAGQRTRYLYPAETGDRLFSHLEAWHRIVSLYQHSHIVRRLASGSPATLEQEDVLLSYPEYSMSELQQVVEAGRLMPAGVTRTMVRGRLLNLRIPLGLLLGETEPASEWDTLRAGWAKHLRLYHEPVYIYEA